MYNLVRWSLFFFVMYLAIDNDAPWLYAVCFIIAWWPHPDQRFAFFNRQSVVDRANRRYNKIMSEQG